MSRKQTFLLLALLTLFAAFLRFYRINDLPPGLFGDEALVTIHARTAVATGVYPIYFGQWDGGFHPAVVYATMLARWVTGNAPYAVRFAMAFIGVINIPLFFFMLWALFRLDYEEPRSRHLALLGAVLFTITFPILLINRVGFEASISVTPVLLVFTFLALGLRTDRRRYYVLSGIALGLSLYAYYYARLLPFTIVLALGWITLSISRYTWKATIANIAIIGFTSLIVFAPLGYYFIQHPDMFFTRASVTGAQTLGDGLAALPPKFLNNTWRTFASISINGFGDFIPRHNLPYRAVFDPFQSVLFWSGLLLLLIRQLRSRVAALLITWFVTMQLPVILFMNLDYPHYTRMMGAMPAMVAIATLGGGALYDVFAEHRQLWANLALSVGLLLSTATTVNDYFIRWANDPALFDAFQVGGWRAASLGLDHVRAGGLVLVSPQVIDDPSDAAFDVLLRGTTANQFPGPSCLAYYDRPAQPLTYIISTLHDGHTFDAVHALYPGGHEGDTIYHQPEPWPLYQIFEVPADTPAQPPANLLSANFGDQVDLVGYQLSPAQPRPGDTLQITLYWRAQTAPDGDFNAFIHLYAPTANAASQPPIAQTDSGPCAGQYVTSRWQPNEIVVDQHTLVLTPDLSGPSIPLVVGLYRWPDLTRLPVSGPSANLWPDNRLLLTSLSIEP
jgi:hypothetical protein